MNNEIVLRDQKESFSDAMYSTTHSTVNKFDLSKIQNCFCDFNLIDRLCADFNFVQALEAKKYSDSSWN